MSGGATGKGINKNIMDDYRYIVQNYTPGDELFFFGFSRGAYTVRALCGMINNIGILKRPDAALIQKSFDHYRNPRKDYALDWMMREAKNANLTFETHLRKGLNPKPDATLHKSRKHIYRSKRPYYRPIDHGKGEVLIHKSVKERWELDVKYRPKNLKAYLEDNDGKWTKLVG